MKRRERERREREREDRIDVDDSCDALFLPPFHLRASINKNARYQRSLSSFPPHPSLLLKNPRRIHSYLWPLRCFSLPPKRRLVPESLLKWFNESLRWVRSPGSLGFCFYCWMDARSYIYQKNKMPVRNRESFERLENLSPSLWRILLIGTRIRRCFPALWRASFTHTISLNVYLTRISTQFAEHLV